MPVVNRYCSCAGNRIRRRELISPFMLPLRQQTGLGLSVFKLFCAENHTSIAPTCCQPNRRSLFYCAVAPVLRRRDQFCSERFQFRKRFLPVSRFNVSIASVTMATFLPRCSNPGCKPHAVFRHHPEQMNSAPRTEPLHKSSACRLSKMSSVSFQE